MKRQLLRKNVPKSHVVWWTYLIGISFLYLVLVSGIFSVLMPNAGHDDALQFRISEAIAAGDWLGRYDNVTLAKGVAYPMWTAFLHLTDTPLWFGNAILYIVAALAVVFSIRFVLKNRWLLALIYTIILFNPFIVTRAYRDSIAPALGLLLVAWVVGVALTIIYYNRKAQKKSTAVRDLCIYAGIGVFTAPMWWFLREDSFWMLPFIIVALALGVLFLVYGFKKKKIHTKMFVAAVVAVTLPIIATVIVGLGIAAMNNQNYKRFVVNDYTSKDFAGAYGALTRIKNDNWQMTVPVSKEMREKAYAVSPAFRELKSCLDNSGKGACEPFIMNIKATGDYEGGWFFWAMRRAVELTGHYSTAAEAEAFYTRLANEVNTACDTGALSCEYGKRATLSAPFRSEIIDPTLDNIGKTAGYVVSLKDNRITYGVSGITVPRDPDAQRMADYYNARYSTEEINDGVLIKNKIGRAVSSLYALFSPLLVILSTLGLVFMTVFLKRHFSYWPGILVAWGLLMLILVRIVMIAYVETTSFPAIDSMYLSSLYPILFLFEGLVLAMATKILIEAYGKRKQLKKLKSKKVKKT